MNINKLLVIGMVVVFGCTNQKKSSGPNYQYKPDSIELYNTIVLQDSAMFDAYNKCELEKMAAFYSEDIEFYHDHGGLSTSKSDIVESIRKNICGKVTRHIIPGSIEVYPIKDYGAIEMGLHWFYNNQEKNAQPEQGSKFIIFWKKENEKWLITRVVSLH